MSGGPRQGDVRQGKVRDTANLQRSDLGTLPSALAARYAVRYRAWDGTQAVEALTPQELVSALADSLLSGEIDLALDRALHRGVRTPGGEQLAGLDALRDQLRAERRRIEETADVAGPLQRMADALRGAARSDTGLDNGTRRLLEALAGHPSAAARLLDLADADARSVIHEALRARQGLLGGVAPSDDDATDYAGDLRAAVERLAALDELEQRIRRVRTVADVGEVDPALVRAVLDDAAAERLERLTRSLSGFAASGYLQGAEGRRELSARALQHLGDELLAALFDRFRGRGEGEHPLNGPSSSHELSGTSRAYRYGDPLTLDLSRTVLDAVRRGAGTPVRLTPDDFAIFEREESARVATVLAIDLSRSMGERGYLLAAKKLALALSTLLRNRFPRDRLLLASFSESARPLQAADLPRLTWDRFSFGTNVQDALRLGRALLADHRGMQRGIVLITDGEPTAHRDLQGEIHFSHPPTDATLAAAYAEAERVRRDGIGLGVCVLSVERKVVRFAEELARRANGDLIVTTPDELGPALVLRYGRARR